MSAVETGLAKYGELTEIGRGSSGTVYRAHQPEFDRDVAIKVVHADLDEAGLELLSAEAAAIGRLSGHPNIVTVYELGVTDDHRPYIVMEFLPGGSLADRLAEDGPVAWPEVLVIGIKLAGTLESAHRAGVLHRDVKPENILFSRFGDLKLVDFGLADVVTKPKWSLGTIGTPAHAAPELLDGRSASPQSEVFALASTLYTLLTGRPPSARGGEPNLVRLATEAADGSRPDYDLLDGPETLRSVLEQALATDPSLRPSTTAQFGRQLQAVQADRGLTITRLPIDLDDGESDTQLEVSRPKRRPGFRRRGGVWAAAVTCALLLAVGGGFLFTRSDDGSVALVPLFSDNFEAGEGWYERSDDTAFLGYDHGRYRITVKQPDHQAISDTSFRGPTYGVPLTALRDVSVHVSARTLSPSGLVGVTCRQEAGAESYYEGLLGTDGGAQIAKYANGQLVTLSRTRLAPRDPNQLSRLRLDCVGEPTSTEVTLFVDGRQATRVIDRRGLLEGSVGVAAASGAAPSADAVFDDLAVFSRPGGAT